MQIVIDVSEEEYASCKKHFENLGKREVINDYEYAIANGTPLPKGHGRLKDENEIKQMIEHAKVKNESSKNFSENIIKFATTIIEADTESEENK